jgi:hypothetical protein
MMRSALVAAMAIFAAALVLVPSAAAAGVPLGAGKAEIAFAAGLDKALRQEKVALKPLGPATLKGRRLTVPVGSGSFDPTAAQASFLCRGGFRLVAGRKAVAVRVLKLDTSSGSLSAIVAGRRVRLARLAGAQLEREGFDAHFVAKRLRLTAAAATALNRAFDLPRAFRAGLSLGSLDGLAEPSEVEVSGQIAIGGPDTVFSRLRSLKVEMGLWGATEGWGTGAEEFFLFPMAPTRVAADASVGVLEGGENDGVTMQIFESPPREMLLRHPHVDLATRELSATLSPLSTEGAVTGTIATLDFSGARVQFRSKVGSLELTGIRAISNQFIADQLNTRFDTPGTFQAGETLARISVVMHS